MSNKDVVKDVKTSVQLEQELQISYAQRGVAVLDIYSAEWGPCRAITETFRRLTLESGEGVHLRFLTVECHSILASLKQPDEQRNPQRPKNIDAIRDTLPEGWQSVLEERAGQSKPYFLFYKEGKKSGFVEGVNTPLIRATVKDLCTVKTPASEFISNPRLQEFWDENFNPEESEITFEKFLKGVANACKYTVSFTDAEKQALLDAIGISKEAKEKTITAEALQKWVGDDEVKTVPILIVEALPDYEARAAGVLAKEAEERKAHEEQKAREAKEEEARKAAEKVAEEERKKAADAAQVQAEAEESTEDLVSRVPELADAAASNETAADEQLRQRVANASLALAPTQLTVYSAETAAEHAQSISASLTSTKTFTANLIGAKGSIVHVNSLRHAAAHKVEGTIPSMAKLASVLVSSDASDVEFLTGDDKSYKDSLQHGRLFADNASIAAELCCTAAIQAPAVLHFSGSKDHITGVEHLAEGASFVLPPLSLLKGEATEGHFTVTLKGLPHAIPFSFAHCYATHWFASFTVESVSDAEVVANFTSFVAQDDFDAHAANFATSANADEKKFLTLEKIQARGPHQAAPTHSAHVEHAEHHEEEAHVKQVASSSEHHHAEEHEAHKEEEAAVAPSHSHDAAPAEHSEPKAEAEAEAAPAAAEPEAEAADAAADPAPAAEEKAEEDEKKDE